MPAVDLQAYVARSRGLDLSAFAWADVARQPVKIMLLRQGTVAANEMRTVKAKLEEEFAARIPWIAGVVRLSIERSGTLFFSFQDLDATKPAGSMKIRVETIAHYLGGHAPMIMARKRAAMPPGCPLLAPAAA